MSSHSLSAGLKNTILETTFLVHTEPLARYDVVIRFLSAEDIPRIDIFGYSDPYFIANIDGHISYTSSILSNTSAPQWDDEEWIVRNIPLTAKLTVKLYDKDDDKLADDYIGQFEILNLINYHTPVGGHEIMSQLGHPHGRFHLSVQSIKSSEESKQLSEYTFDGPCRYYRHNSVAIGRLTMINADCIYSTWKTPMRRISFFFPPYERQHWNKNYKVAREIFNDDPLSLVPRTALKLAHKILYGRTLKHNECGRLNNADDLWKNVFFDRATKKVKPCVYSYVIDEYSWRFSETGNQCFVDIASKHALLSNCSECVRYAGEFHPRPKYGWDKWDDEWELVFDNGSGTYAPNADLLVNLKKLLLFNFPGLNIVTYDQEDPKLKESVKQLESVVKEYKNSTVTIKKIVPDPSCSQQKI